MPGLLGKKIGMTHIFTEDRARIPVTAIQVGPCAVVTKKTPDKDGYGAIQLGYDEIDAKKSNKPYAGHFLKKKQKIYRVLKEFPTASLESYSEGDILSADCFSDGDLIDVCGVSKGKGFQGVMKRYGFSGGFKTHGCSISHRAPGSIGQNTFPGRVFKGRKLPGRMGGKRVTQRGLTIVGVEADRNVILVKGSIPGANDSLVMVKPRQDGFEKKFSESKKQPEAEAGQESQEDKA